VVALLVRLKLTLLRNGLRRSVWRLVGLVVGGVYALGIVAAVLAGMAALRGTSPATTADVTVLAYSGLTLGWLLLSLLVFGVDETVDPAKFALLPVRARDLLPGLLVAGAVGVPGVATILVALGLLVTWSRSFPLTVGALVAIPLGVVTCLLLARTATSAFASFLASRRFRDAAFVLLALVGAALAVGSNLLGGLARVGPGQLRGALATAAEVAGWTPFGWAWALPADVARGRWLAAGVHLVLAVALVGMLWVVWRHFLAARLVEPVEGGGGEATRVTRSGWVERLYPASPAGGIAARSLRYWRRDPRYLAGAAGFLIAPVVIIATTLLNPDGSTALAVFAPSMLGLLISASAAQDLSYDGSALWTHVSSGVSGAADRLGRVLSTLTVFAPMLVVLLVVAFVLSGAWSLLGPAVGLTVTFLLTGLGVGSFVGALWQWPAPPPGASPFQKGSSGGLPAFLSFSVTTLATLLLALPTIALAVASIWAAWVGWLTVPVGLATGLVVLRVGVRLGGRLLERTWPEVMLAVSERSG
jgi:ABC-2 type transport system permease protein